VLPLPEDEDAWEEPAPDLRHPPAAACGATSCRTSSNVRAAGLIAMKLDEGDQPRSASPLCTRGRRRPADHAPCGRCIRFQATGRCARVRRARHAPACAASFAEGEQADRGDQPAPSSTHVDASVGERAAFLKRANAARRAATSEAEAQIVAVPTPRKAARRHRSVSCRAVRGTGSEREEFLLTVTDGGLRQAAPRPA
jgi:DNA gyrase subunit A